MQHSRILVSSIFVLLIAITIWFVSSRIFDTTCAYNSENHKLATCVDSVSEMLANPEVYDGKLVVVPGEFGFPLEGSYLKDKINGSSIWLNLDLASYDNLKHKCRFTGQLKGVFTFGSAGHFGHWPGKLDVTEVVSIDTSKSGECL